MLNTWNTREKEEMSPYTSEVRLETLVGIQRKVIHKGWLCYVIFKERNTISHYF